MSSAVLTLIGRLVAEHRTNIEFALDLTACIGTEMRGQRALKRAGTLAETNR